MRDENKSYKLGKYLTVEILLGFDKEAPEIEPLLDVTEGFFYNVLHPIQMKCRKGIYLLVGDKSKISEIPVNRFALIFFVVDLPASYRSVFHFKELCISFFVFLDEFTFLKFGTQLGDPFIKSLLVISTFFDAVVVMDIDPSFILDNIALIRSLLRVIPFCRDCISVSVDALVVVVNMRISSYTLSRCFLMNLRESFTPTRNFTCSL